MKKFKEFVNEKYDNRVEEFIKKLQEIVFLHLDGDEWSNADYLSEIGDLCNTYKITSDELQSIINDDIFDHTFNNYLNILKRDTDEIEGETSLSDKVDQQLRDILSDLDLEESPYTYCQECGSGDKSIGGKSIEEAIIKIKKIFNWE